MLHKRSRRAAFPCAIVVACLLAISAWSVVPALGVDRSASYAAALDSISAGELQQQVDFLADEEREGREAGTRGGLAAGQYLRDRLIRLKLHGAGSDNGYFQGFSPNFRNVLAVLDGSDAKLRDQVILLGAHYDHVGRGQKGNSLGTIGMIHPGADDNASGTSGLLELAQAFTRLAEPPRRTIVFAFWDAEEKGLLGSKHWIANPTIPLDRIRMMMNFDMIGRLRNDRVIVFGTRSGAGLRQFAAEHNESPLLRLEFPWITRPDGDHYTFFSHEIPVLFLHTDVHDQYHRPSDKANLINSSGMRRVVRLAFSLAYDTANAETIPAFRTEAKHETDETRRSRAEQGRQLPERLGADWENETPAPRGVRLVRIAAQSPAERGGLHTGDRLVEFAGRPIRSSDDLTGAVLTAPMQTSAIAVRPGDANPIRAKIALDGKPLRIGIVWRVDDAEPGVAIISYVVPGSPAAEAGLQAEDRIERVAGRNFSSESEFANLLNTLPGPIRIRIERNGQMQQLEISLGTARVQRAA